MKYFFSKFRKKKSTKGILEELQAQIRQQESYKINILERKTYFVNNFVGFVIGAYVLCFAIWYAFYFPPSLRERIMYLVPLLLFPVLIVLLRKVFARYFQRKLNKNDFKLSQLNARKTKLLEQVMNTETYKEAVYLLDRFGDKNRHSLNGSILHPQQWRTPPPAPQQRVTANYPGAQQTGHNTNLNSNGRSAQFNYPVQRPRTPFPIVDIRTRTIWDRLVDFVIGDSPQNRYGMICKACHCHNGLVPPEEYPYTTFWCAFCHSFNPAAKRRPIGPRLSPLAKSQDDSDQAKMTKDQMPAAAGAEIKATKMTAKD